MVVERVGLDRVKERLAGLKRKPEQAGVETIEEIQRRIEEQEEEEKSKR